MSDFRYLLTVLGNGRTEYLERALESIEEHLTPQPFVRYIYDDSETHLGQCAAQSMCWEAASNTTVNFCLHWEEDYVALRPLDVERMAALMDAQPHLLQLTLMRQAWAAEIPYGNYVAKDPGWYERRELQLSTGRIDRHGNEEYAVTEWMETTRNWANAPTLFRTALAREFEWPTEPGCETAIGPEMLARYPEGKFGIAGWGQAEVAHVGVERAPGSYGY